jgi:hypothetical protein
MTDTTNVADAAPAQDAGQRYLQMLAEWEDVKRELAAAKDRELELRLQLFAGAFPTPKEGTNTYKLPDGRQIKGKYDVNRKIDEAAFPAVLADLREQGVANADRLVRFKPELAKSEWNTLSEAFKLAFSRCVIASPGTPQLELVPAPVKK